MNARHVWTVAKKEFRGIGQERTIVLAILLQVFIAMFSSFLVIGLTSLYDPASMDRSGSVYAVGYAGADSPLQGILEADDTFAVYRMDLSPAVAALKERQLAAVVYVPPTPPDAVEPVQVTLYTLKNDIQTAVVGVELKEDFEEYETFLRYARADRLSAAPIEVAVPAGTGGQSFFLFIYGLLIPLLLFMPAIISASLIIDFITEEYSARTLDTLLSTPLTFTEILWGKVFAAWVLVPLQGGAWLLLLGLNGIAVHNIVEVLVHVSAASLVLILLGALAALHFRDRTNAQFIFSTGLVVVLLVALAIPANPANFIVLLAAGADVPWHWAALAVVLCGTLLLAAVTDRYARTIARRAMA
ncbi:ABC transporter permease [Methanofollis sp. UBA420]|jgi:ABC-type Na+ efflux pump permease subunit|uniref:ABC transporter permease n=1 Tax=Methanofollis sp. UBA420 TaxID=1915514 RepID=UPI00316ADBD0